MSQFTLQRLRRLVQLDRRNGWVAGVCAGAARALEVDPAIVRVSLVVSAVFLPKLTIALYLIAWIVLDEPARR